LEALGGIWAPIQAAAPLLNHRLVLLLGHDLLWLLLLLLAWRCL
jgi:hypothetical protein